MKLSVVMQQHHKKRAYFRNFNCDSTFLGLKYNRGPTFFKKKNCTALKIKIFDEGNKIPKMLVKIIPPKKILAQNSQH